MNRLSLADVSGARRGRMLFDHVSLDLAEGDAGTVIGPNGSGKSTLLRIAAGLLAPAAGRVERTGGIALLAEDMALDAERSVAEALGFWARLDRVGQDAVERALVDGDLAMLAPVPIRLLSTGQRRRVAMARVLASGAPIWLLDEPANGLDMAALARLEALIARHRDGGGIALVATHLAIALPGATAVAL